MLGKMVPFIEKNKTGPLSKSTYKIKDTTIKSEDVGKYICNQEEYIDFFNKTWKHARIKNFLSMRGTRDKVNRQMVDWERIFQYHKPTRSGYLEHTKSSCKSIRKDSYNNRKKGPRIGTGNLKKRNL